MALFCMQQAVLFRAVSSRVHELHQVNISFSPLDPVYSEYERIPSP